VKGADTWDDEGRRARAALAGGSLALLFGLAIVGVGPSDVGMAITLAALLATIYGIHTFGRLGPPSPDPSLTPRKRKKRRAEPADAGGAGS
jgi:hypothetical protein